MRLEGGGRECECFEGEGFGLEEVAGRTQSEGIQYAVEVHLLAEDTVCMAVVTY